MTESKKKYEMALEMNQDTQELIAIKQEVFMGVCLDLYKDSKNNVFMTRNQIGEALGYASKGTAIKNIHQRNKERLDQFSRVAQIELPFGGRQEVTVYNEKGIYDIARFSKQKVANDFFDFVYDMISGLRKGELTIQGNVQPMASYMIEDPIQRAERWIEEQKEKLALEQENQKLVPLATYTTDVLKSENTINSTTIGKEYGISAQKLNALLKELGVHYKRGSIWHLYAKYHDQDYKRTETYLNNGKTYESNSWTQKGRKFIVDSLKELGILTLKQGGKDSPKRVNHILKFGLEDYKENYK